MKTIRASLFVIACFLAAIFIYGVITFVYVGIRAIASGGFSNCYTIEGAKGNGR